VASADAEKVAEGVLLSRRYRGIARPIVLRIAERELRSAGGSVNEAIKRSKRALHRVYGAFMAETPRYGAWLRALSEARGDPARKKAAAAAILNEHASTRERSRDLEGFYEALFARAPRPRRVLDAACGLHPLAVPWMDLPCDATYIACDIDQAAVDFLDAALTEIGIAHEVFVADLTELPRLPEADLALALKVLPCLEFEMGERALDLVDVLRAPVVALSFPAHSLGGRRRRMGDHHAGRFERAAASRGWELDSFEAAGERVYLVQRPSAGAGSAVDPQP
jgi:16S rRNA (guanine(1405)-N(7))-methyltransferase